MKTPVFFIDLDAVTFQSIDHLLELYNHDYDDHLTIADITQWNIHKVVKQECGTKVYDYFESPNFYTDCSLVEGVAKGIQELRNLGKVLFLTAGSLNDKVSSLKKHGLIEDSYKGNWDVVLSHDKSLLRGELLVDDHAVNLDGFLGLGLLFSHGTPWNLLSAYQYRANGWSDVLIWAKFFLISQCLATFPLQITPEIAFTDDRTFIYKPKGAARRPIAPKSPDRSIFPEHFHTFFQVITASEVQWEKDYPFFSYGVTSVFPYPFIK